MCEVQWHCGISGRDPDQYLNVLLQLNIGRMQEKKLLTYSIIHHFETVPNSKKLQTTTEMWLLKDFKTEIA